jgi:hypothetical protein
VGNGKINLPGRAFAISAAPQIDPAVPIMSSKIHYALHVAADHVRLLILSALLRRLSIIASRPPIQEIWVRPV